RENGGGGPHEVRWWGIGVNTWFGCARHASHHPPLAVRAPGGPPPPLRGGGCEHQFPCSNPATVLISLRAYLGRPALIDSPELNDDCPIKTCAGTRLRSTGTFSNSRFSSSTFALIARLMKAVTTVLSGSEGCA